MQGLARRYGAWQVRDYVVERGLWTAILGLALLALFWVNYDATPPRWLTHPPPGMRGQDPALMLAQWIREEPRRFRGSVEMLFATLGFFGTLIATHGVVSRDRERGFHRFLFAKPVDMPAYYAQAFAISGAGLLTVSTGLLGLTALLFGRAVPLSALGVVGTEFVLLGGLVFLLSALWRFDFILAALSVPVAGLVAAFAHEFRGGSVWAKLLEPLLPPLFRAGRFAEAMTGPELVRPADFAIVFGYGALCFAAGLYVLRRRAGAGG